MPGLTEKLNSDDADNVAQSTVESQSAPANVELLQSKGIAFEHRPATKDIVAKCVCGARLVIDEAEPYAWCMGRMLRACRVNGMSFDEVVAALAESEART